MTIDKAKEAARLLDKIDRLEKLKKEFYKVDHISINVRRDVDDPMLKEFKCMFGYLNPGMETPNVHDIKGYIVEGINRDINRLYEILYEL